MTKWGYCRHNVIHGEILRYVYIISFCLVEVNGKVSAGFPSGGEVGKRIAKLNKIFYFKAKCIKKIKFLTKLHNITKRTADFYAKYNRANKNGMIGVRVYLY